MTLSIVDFPAEPHCGGAQWTVADTDALADQVAAVMQGRAADVADALAGATLLDVMTPDDMKAAIKKELFPTKKGAMPHRDGLLFEIICWLVAAQQATADEVVTEPHTKATKQGMDTLKVAWDDGSRQLTAATIYEYKCTTNAQKTFRYPVMKAFRDFNDGKRNTDLIQQSIALLARFGLTNEERRAAFTRIVKDRPLIFEAALTVTPHPFGTADCVALFDYFENFATRPQRRGSTMPLTDVRQWFSDFAELVWSKIDV
ncbi:MAG TPA: hypothetical protein VM471_01815 [Phenylobacterium sp.]|jgi:hypothetical protein|nr:hypothetical protein [Phenylobacterium sp.]